MAQRYDKTYVVKVGDNLGDPAFWNGRFKDIDLRLAALEETFKAIDAAADALVASGLDRLDSTISPLITSLTTQVNSLTTQVANLTNSISSETGSVTAQLNALLVTAQDLVADLETTGTFDGGSF